MNLQYKEEHLITRFCNPGVTVLRSASGRVVFTSNLPGNDTAPWKRSVFAMKQCRSRDRKQ
jgi:hypothetical protein